MKKRIFLLVLILMTAFATFASKAFPIEKNVVQPDGSVLTLRLVGDEFLHGYSTIDGIRVCKDKDNRWCYAQYSFGVTASNVLAKNPEHRTIAEDLQAKRLSEQFQSDLSKSSSMVQRADFSSQLTAAVSAKGSPVIPLVLVQFADVKFTQACDSTFFDAHFNAENYQEEGGHGSVKDYFVAQSDSQFIPHFHVVGVITLPENMAYYGGNKYNNDKNDLLMMQQALDSLVARHFDFTPYLVNGKIPLAAFIYAGYGEQASDEEDAVWAKCYPSINTKVGDYTVGAVLCTNEIADYTGEGPQADGIGTFVHEFSHALGLPDFYADGNFGLDYWDLMDWGQYVDQCRRPVGYSAYERMFMGWLQPQQLEEKKQRVELSPLASKDGVRSIIIKNPANANEYLMLENRTESTWFSNYYGEGMLVYHIDYNSTYWSRNTVNRDANHPRISIIPADNTLTPFYVEKGGKRIYAKQEDYMGDLYPGVKNNPQLTPTSTPPAMAFTGGTFPNGYFTRITRLANSSVQFVYMDNGKLFILGDLNDDLDINVGDLTQLVELIMNGFSDSSSPLFNAADVCTDNEINVGDLTSLVKIIMEQQ